MLKNNSKMLLINCIYKINKYKFLFLIIVGHITLNITFYVEFAFVVKKQKKDFDEF